MNHVTRRPLMYVNGAEFAPGDRRHGSQRRPAGARTPPLAAVATHAPIVPPVCDVPDPADPEPLGGVTAVAVGAVTVSSAATATANLPSLPSPANLPSLGDPANGQPVIVEFRPPITTISSFRWRRRALPEHSRRNVTQRQPT